MSEWKLDKDTCRRWINAMDRLRFRKTSFDESLLEYKNTGIPPIDFRNYRQILELSISDNSSSFQGALVGISRKRVELVGDNRYTYVNMLKSIEIDGQIFSVGDNIQLNIKSISVDGTSFNPEKMKIKIIGFVGGTNDLVVELRGRFRRMCHVITKNNQHFSKI